MTKDVSLFFLSFKVLKKFKEGKVKMEVKMQDYEY